MRLKQNWTYSFALVAALSSHASAQTPPDPALPTTDPPAPALAPTATPPSYSAPSDAYPTDTARHDSEREFSRGLEWVYFNIEGGFETVGLRTLHTSNLLPETVDTSGSGAFFGLGGGLRLVFLTIGPRYRTGHFEAWNLWTLDLEAGIHLPIGRVEPYFTFAGGYAKLATNDTNALQPVDLSIRGFNARTGFGLDVYVNKYFTLGANGTFDVLAMSRPGVDVSSLSPQAQAGKCDMLTDPTQKQQCAMEAVYSVDGSSIGMAFSLSLVAGVHF